MRSDVAWIAACVLAAPLAAGAETIVVVDGPPALVEALEARGHRVLARDDVAEHLHALDPADRAAVARLTREGREALYDSADLTTARERLEEALRRGGEGLPRADRARLQLDLGVAHLAAGDRAAADRAVTAALRLDPDVAIDPSVHGPPVRRLVEHLRARAPRPARDDDAALRADFEVAPSDPEAALRVARALDADLAIAARWSNGRWTARVNGPRRREGRVVAATLAEIAAGVDAESAARASASAARGSAHGRARAHGDDDEGGGIGVAWWIGGGAALVVAGVVVGALVLADGDDTGGMTLVASFEDE